MGISGFFFLVAFFLLQVSFGRGCFLVVFCCFIYCVFFLSLCGCFVFYLYQVSFFLGVIFGGWVFLFICLLGFLALGGFGFMCLFGGFIWGGVWSVGYHLEVSF